MKKVHSLKPFSLIFSLACCFLFINCEEELPRYDIEITHGEGGVVDQSSGSYESGTQLVVQAIADQDHVFVNWTGGIVSTDNPLTIDVCEDDNIQANFKEKERELIIEITGEGEVLQEIVSGSKSEASGSKSTETEYNSGSIVKLTAVPNDGWQFDRWTGDIGSSEPSIQVTMNEAKTISALFTKVDYPLEVNTVGQGTVTEEIVANKTTDYESGTIVKLTAVADAEWVFSGWSGDITSTDPEIEITIDEAKSVTATFIKKQYELTINTVGEGTVTETVISSKTDSYDAGTLIKLTAVPDIDHVFQGWSGDITSTDSEIQITVDQAKTVTATFIEKQYDLTINTVGQGSVDELILDDTVRGLNIGTKVRLTAIPDAGWVFSGWSGDVTSSDAEIEITVDAAKSVTATFVKKQYELTVNIVGQGSVNEQIVSVSDDGTIVKLTADAGTEWVFSGWSGSITSTDVEIQFTVDEAKSITATFVRKQYELTINVVGQGSVNEQIESTSDNGTLVKLTAIADTGWVFSGWTGDYGGGETEIEISVNEPKTLTATFIKKQYALEINTVGQGSVTEEILANKTTDYESGTIVKLTAVAEEEWEFSGWSGDAAGVNPEIQVTVDQAKSITATFVKKQYELTINTVGQGTVTEEVVSSKTTEYDSGTLIKLTAQSEEGWVFSGWSGDITSTDSEIQISVDEAKTITATFIEKEYELTINTVGQGTVNEQIVEDNTRGLSVGTTVRLTAIPDAEWVFSGWSGDITSTDPEIEITIDEAKTVTATFVKKQYELTVNIVGQGSVSEQIVSVTDAGTIVNLTADPGTEWVFSGWSGDASGTNPEIQVTVDQAKSITATFVRKQYELTVNIVGQGSVSEQIVSESDSGTIVKLTATADEDWVFTGWTGDYGGTETEIEISVNEPKTLTATFVKKQYALEVNINGQGSVTEAIVSSKSTDYDTGTIVKLTAVPEENWKFKEWTGDVTGTDLEIQLTVDEAKSVTATFERKNQSLEVIIVGDGSVNQKASGTSVTLEATPAEDWIFQGWSGDVTSQDATITFTLDDVEVITATFVKKQFTLEVNTVGEGTVTEQVIASKSTDYDIDSKIKLTAVPKENWKFKEWTGDVTGTNLEVEITMDAAKSVTATFEKIEFDLEVNTVGQGSVTETKQSSKTTTYESGDVITLKAVPDTNWKFTGWSGDASGTDTEIEITMNKAKSVTATFEKIQFTLEITTVGNGSVSEQIISSKSTYDSGTIVKLTANPDANNDFVSWTGDATGSSAEIQITLDSNKSITATFAAQEPVYLDDNGVTIKARPWASVGQSSVINGKTYTIIDQTQLQAKIINGVVQGGEDVTLYCTTRITSMAQLFENNSTFNEDIRSWDLTNVTNTGKMFNRSTAFNQDISKWNTANVTDMGSMFRKASNFSADISDWNVSKVRFFSNMFEEANSFNAPIGKWTTTSLEETTQMFFKNTLFNQSLNNWNVSKVTDMEQMFYEATSFNGNVSNWNTESATNMTDLFQGASNFNQNIGQWNVSSVEFMNNMFREAVKFNQDISAWNTSKVKNMSFMFAGRIVAGGSNLLTVFDQDISNWNVSNVTDKSNFDQFSNPDWTAAEKPNFN